MSFLSLKFVIFILAVILIYSLLRKENHRQAFLLFASYIFYGAADIRFLAILFVISIAVWMIGEKIEQGKNKILFRLGVVLCVLALGYFKYFGFFVSSFVRFFGRQTPGALNIMLPLGISFYIFQAISYLCDVHWGKIEAEHVMWKVLLYIGFFPQITAGPIVKAKDFLPQLTGEHRICTANLNGGLQRAAVGVFKKVVIADRLGRVVNAVYGAPAAYSGFSLLMAACSYAIQIYCDFSGYSDIAIGVAEIFGYDLGKNFDMPYIARNPSDFWRRWHISLSSWFRDYVYIPLGGSRKGKIRNYINLFVTMLLSGLWHGANWTFVIWGALHGAASSVHKMFRDIIGKEKGADSKLLGFLSVCATTIVVWFLWIPFRAATFSEAMLIVSRIFTMASGITYVSVFSVIYILLIMAIQWISVVKSRGHFVRKVLDFTKFWHVFAFTVFVLVIIVFAYVGDTAFIYAQF